MTLSIFLINLGIEANELTTNQIRVARKLSSLELPTLAAKKVAKLVIEANRIPTNMGIIALLSEKNVDYFVDSFSDLVAMSIVISMIAIDMDENGSEKSIDEIVDSFLDGVQNIMDEGDAKEFLADLATYLGWSPRWKFDDIIGFLEDKKPDDFY